MRQLTMKPLSRRVKASWRATRLLREGCDLSAMFRAFAVAAQSGFFQRHGAAHVRAAHVALRQIAVARGQLGRDGCQVLERVSALCRRIARTRASKFRRENVNQKPT